MDELDFTMELNSDDLPKDLEYQLFTEAEDRLREVARGRDDLTGAAVTIRQPGYGDTGELYEVTVVAYVRPENVAATEKREDPTQALKDALDAVIRQIRDRRAKLKRRWERPGNDPVSREIEEIMAAEEYDTIVPDDEE